MVVQISKAKLVAFGLVDKVEYMAFVAAELVARWPQIRAPKVGRHVLEDDEVIALQSGCDGGDELWNDHGL
jgi:hypothetical protein